MPPRTPPPSAKPRRRRPGPALPSSWIWLVILLTIIGMFIFATLSSEGIGFNQLLALVEDPQLTSAVKRVTFLGTDKITGEVDVKKIPDDPKYNEIRKKLGNGKFSMHQPPKEDRARLIEDLTKLD